MNANDILKKQKELSEQIEKLKLEYEEFGDKLSVGLDGEISAYVLIYEDRDENTIKILDHNNGAQMHLTPDQLKAIFNWLNEIGVLKTFPRDNAKIKEYNKSAPLRRKLTDNYNFLEKNFKIKKTP